MIVNRKNIVPSLILTLLFVVAGFAQQTQPAASPAAKEPEYVTEKGFKGKVFEIKHREPLSLYRAIHALGSGFKGATMSYSNEDKIIAVRDFPENIAAIEEAIKRLDVPEAPEPPQPNIELITHVLLASNVAGAVNEYPADLKDVVKQLQTTLNYKNYFLLNSIIQRTKDGGSIIGQGTTRVSPPLSKSEVDAPYNFIIRKMFLDKAAGNPQININSFSFTLNPQNYPHVVEAIGNAAINSDFSLREGEKVVVGTASLKDKALILVVTARVLK